MIRILPRDARDLVDILGAVSGNNVIDEIRAVLQDQLDSPNHEEEVIEFIATILASSSGTRLSNNLVSKLRMALLSPRELAAIKAQGISPRTCFGCGKEVITGEMVTIHGTEFYCTVCTLPQLWSCGKCRTHMGMPSGIGRILTKATKECAACAAGVHPPDRGLDAPQPIEAARTRAQPPPIRTNRLEPPVVTTTFYDGPNTIQPVAPIGEWITTRLEEQRTAAQEVRAAQQNAQLEQLRGLAGQQFYTLAQIDEMRRADRQLEERLFRDAQGGTNENR